MKEASKQQKIRNIMRKLESIIDPDCPHTQLRMAIFETALKDAVLLNVSKYDQYSAQNHIRNGLDYMQELGIDPEYISRLIRRHDLGQYFYLENHYAA